MKFMVVRGMIRSVVVTVMTEFSAMTVTTFSMEIQALTL